MRTEPRKRSGAVRSRPENDRRHRIARVLIAPLSVPGALLGTLFFAFSLTPSLLPRSALMQGIVSGFSLTAGYAVGVFGAALWGYLELPRVHGRVHRIGRIVAAAVCVLTAAVFLWKASGWQNSIRALMSMEPVEGVRPLTVGVVALLIFLVLLLLARLFRMTQRLISHALGRVVPPRVSFVIGITVTAVLFWSLASGVLLRSVLRTADESLRQIDARIESDTARPEHPLKSGSPESLLEWSELGRAGRGFVASGPSRDDLQSFFGERDVQEPIRVYVGLNSAETAEERAQLALQELERVGAFDRSVLLVITPTGTGWVDPGAIDTVEFLHRGDIASVAVQYSYLVSALALLVEPEHGAETAAALFAAVYEHWRTLPEERRPKLYLHGLSLGALHSDRSFDIFDVIAAPFDGALWSGPPFRSETWQTVTARREPGTPAWLPKFRDSTVVRFTDQHNRLPMPGVPWGPLRIAYLQYATDPITFFEPSMLYRQPEWMQPPRGPDVTPQLRWIPIVTMLQVVADMRAGDLTPHGHGHNFAPEHYIDAWLALTEPPGWRAADTPRLKAWFEGRGAVGVGD